MSDTPRTSALTARAGIMVVPPDEPVVLRRDCAEIEQALQRERDEARKDAELLSELFVNATAERDKARADAERLRARLRECAALAERGVGLNAVEADDMFLDIARRAEAALAQKEDGR